MSRKVKDRIGEVYGILTIVEEVEPHLTPSGNKLRKFLCECECGNSKEVTIDRLKKGKVKSCGCLRWHGGDNHGLSRHALYKTWKNMIDRCNLPSHKSCEDYGGRGIRVCDRWLDVKNFIEDMGERPEGCTLDRIDNDGDYEPDNCRWGTYSEQNHNKNKYTRNTSGVDGVSFQKSLNNWKAQIVINKKHRSKSFSINKYGEEEAFRLACEAMEGFRKDLDEYLEGQTS